MKNKSTTSEEDKIRLRFKAKDLDRIDLEEMRRQLEAIQQSETVTEPEPVEEEPVVVVPPDSAEVVEPEPKHEPKESWRWANLPWKGAAIGVAVVSVLVLLTFGVVSLVKVVVTEVTAKKVEPVQSRDWPDIPNINMDSEWRIRAETGNLEAQYLWASHLTGKLDKDPKPAPKVFEFYDRAAKEPQSHSRTIPAMRNLAWCYDYGVGTEVNDEEAEKWKKRADKVGMSAAVEKAGDGRVKRTLISGMVLLGWALIMIAVRGKWRRRLNDVLHENREQVIAAVHFDFGAFLRSLYNPIGVFIIAFIPSSLILLNHYTGKQSLADVNHVTAIFSAVAVGIGSAFLFALIFAIFAPLADVDSSSDAPVSSGQDQYVLCNRDLWGVLAENAFLILAGAMMLAWLEVPWQAVDGFDYLWARITYFCVPAMCFLVCLGVRFLKKPALIGTGPRPWVHLSAKGLQMHWGMFTSAAILIGILFASMGIWVYGEKSGPANVIELSGNSYKLLESGFLLPVQRADENKPHIEPASAKLSEPSAKKPVPTPLSPVSTAEDQAEFARCLSQSKRGDIAASYNLALMYLDGRGIKQDSLQAYYWWVHAARWNHVPSIYNEGVCLWEGLGVKKDEDEAIKRFQSAKNHGFAPARIALGTVYRHMSIRPNQNSGSKNYYRKQAIQILLTDKSLPGAIPIDRSEERPPPNP